MSAELATLLVSMVAAFGTAALTLAGVAVIARRRARSAAARSLVVEPEVAIALLFEDEALIDATPAARQMLASAGKLGTDWARFASAVRLRFPGLDAAVADLADKGSADIAADDVTGDRLTATWLNGVARIVIQSGGEGKELLRGDNHAHAAAESELKTLRAITRAAPVAVWKQDTEGAIVWANEFYFGLARDVAGEIATFTWPPPALFPVPALTRSEVPAAPKPFRASLRPADGKPARWFECQCQPMGELILCFGTPVDSVVRAEEALREFVQTLSKTFADLPIGLAVFDRTRRLALFNPALTDLTTLDISFLSARPSLFAFLDQLREKRRIPEPRDYRGWRQRMTELETSAASGFVQENWALPTGQTFRVTGRPHPDGAIAFLFEDISAEMSLTRRFRSEIELGQTVIDSLDEAIAVFSPAGTLSFSNTAYGELWGIDPSLTLAEVNIGDATRHWQTLSEQTHVWAEVRDFLAALGERTEWSATVRLKDGSELSCRMQPLAGGATLIGFRAVEDERKDAPRAAPTHAGA